MTARSLNRPVLMMLAVCLAWLGASAPARAIEVTQPLQGYYRPGRYMPVQLSVSAGNLHTVVFSADGAMPVECRVGESGRDLVIPVLCRRELAGDLLIETGGSTQRVTLPLKPLAANDRLVAFAGLDPLAIATLPSDEPGTQAVRVTLDTTRPLLTPAAAYECLDALLLDTASASRIGEAQLSQLLAAGVTVAIQSPQRPVGTWPWKQIGGFWVIQHAPGGPRALVNADAYLPTYSWIRGRPDSTRRMLLLAAIVGSALLILALLFLRRYALPAVLLLCVAGAIATIVVSNRQPADLRLDGDILQWDGELLQQDRWTYVSTLQRNEPALSMPFQSLSHPVLSSRRQESETPIRLICRPDGVPDHFAFRCPPDATLAFIARSVRPGPPPPSTQPVTSPMLPLAERLYPGQVTGQISPAEPTNGDRWPAVVTYVESNRKGG